MALLCIFVSHFLFLIKPINWSLSHGNLSFNAAILSSLIRQTINCFFLKSSKKVIIIISNHYCSQRLWSFTSDSTCCISTFCLLHFLSFIPIIRYNNFTLPSSWIPFGYGRRQCVGQQFARSVLFLYLASIFRRWKLVPSPGRQLVSCDPRDQGNYESKVTIRPKPFYCRFEKRYWIENFAILFMKYKLEETYIYLHVPIYLKLTIYVLKRWLPGFEKDRWCYVTTYVIIKDKD